MGEWFSWNGATRNQDSRLTLGVPRNLSPIQGRAVRRVGELLEAFQRKGARTDLGRKSALGSQRTTAKAAGLTKHDEKQARRVAAIPAAEFEAAHIKLLAERAGGAVSGRPVLRETIFDNASRRP